MHQIADFCELLAELAAGMQFSKILGLEALAQAYRNGERIAQRQHCRGARRRRQVQAAGFAFHAAVERHIARLRQRRLQIAAETDQRIAFALERRQQSQNLLSLAACGERNDHVAGHQHAEVAVHRFGGMQKQCRASGRTQRCGNLLRDDAALAHAGDDHAPIALAAAHNQLDGAIKVCGHRAIEPRGQRLQRRSLCAHQLRWPQAVLFLVAIHRFLMVTLQGIRDQGSGIRDQRITGFQTLQPLGSSTVPDCQCPLFTETFILVQ